MSNLGAYEVFATQAKIQGGVENALRAVGARAVANAAPGLIGMGTAIGVGVGVLATLGVILGKQRWDEYKATRDLAGAEGEVMLTKFFDTHDGTEGDDTPPADA